MTGHSRRLSERPRADISKLPQTESRSGPIRITYRSIFLGLATGALLNIYSDYTGMILGSASLVKSQLPIAMLMPFVAWVVINTTLKFVRPSLALRSHEMLVIYSCSWIVGTVPASGWTTYWGGIVSAPVYHASPENAWKEHLFDILPWWNLPHRSDAIIRTYYEGIPAGQAIPWSGWFGSLFWWTAVSVALVIVGLCIAIIFQKQWEHAERLTFPLAEFPLELTRGFDSDDRIPVLFRNRIFWAGFFSVFAVFVYNITGYFYPDLPRLAIYDDVNTKVVTLARGFPQAYLRILPPVIGFTFLCNLEILLSLWVFRVFAILQEGLMTRVGFAVGLQGQQAEAAEIMTLESHGALVFLAIYAVWVARHHLAGVWRCVKEGPRSQNDDGWIPYRYALLGLIAGCVFIIGWFRGLGLSLGLCVFHLALMLVGYFTVSKFIALTGFPYLFPVGRKGGEILQMFTGTANLGNSDFIGLGFINSNAFFGNIRIPAWPALPHHLRMFGRATHQRLLVFWSAPAAFAVGMVASCVFIVYLGYAYAGQNLGLTGFSTGHIRTYDGMVTAMINDDKTLPDPGKATVWALGFGFAYLLTMLGNRLSWWPLHPLGFAFQTMGGSRFYAFSIFLVWLTKLAILRIGGIALYNRSKPYFIGLVIGYVVSVATSAAVDFIWFPDDGHGVHNW